jgi:DnaJ-class molecular chaperone
MANEFEEQEEKIICSACNGTGVIEQDLDDDGDQTYEEECCACGGTGYEN